MTETTPQTANEPSRAGHHFLFQNCLRQMVENGHTSLTLSITDVTKLTVDISTTAPGEVRIEPIFKSEPSDFVGRLKIELFELAEKIRKAVQFQLSLQWNDLTIEHQFVFNTQVEAMKIYYTALQRRYQLLNSKDNIQTNETKQTSLKEA